jgi:hypothetical protein
VSVSIHPDKKDAAREGREKGRQKGPGPERRFIRERKAIVIGTEPEWLEFRSGR